MNLGETIGELTQKSNLNLRQLAMKAGISYSTLYAIVKRKSKRMDIDALQRIADALGVSVFDLLIGSPSLGNDETTIEDLKFDTPEYETRILLEPSLGVGKTTVVKRITKVTGGPLHRVADAMDKLNEEGQEKVAIYAEDLAGITRYRATDAPQSTPPAEEGTDTTPAEIPPEVLQEPPKKRIQTVTMICPICGMALRGDLEDGQAHCDYCKRSFPLPQILK